MSNQELISVVIPIYNVEDYLSACLESLLAQTYPCWEAILVNDGSTDASAQIAETYCRKDHRFILLTQENQGQSVARNVGISSASGAYIYFLDSDDILASWIFEHWIQLFKKHPEIELVCSNAAAFSTVSPLFSKSSSGMLMSFQELYAQVLIPRSYFGPFYFMFKSDFFIKHQLFFVEHMIYEDAEWGSRLFSEKGTCFYDSTVFYGYRIRPKSTMTSPFSRNNIHNYIRCIRIVFKRLAQYPDNVALRNVHYLLLCRLIFELVFKGTRSGLFFQNECRYLHNVVRTLLKISPGIHPRFHFQLYLLEMSGMRCFSLLYGFRSSIFRLLKI